MKRILFFSSLIFSGLMTSAQPASGLIGYFNFNGSAVNSGSAGVTANPVGTSYTTNATNTPNKAILFGGTLSSYVDFADNGSMDFTGTNNFTVAFSFYFNGTSTGGLIDNCLNYGGWGVWLWSTVAGTWNIQFNYKNNSVGSAAATAFTKGAWHHVAAVRNNGTLSVYIDGVFRASAPEGTTAPSYPLNMIAGAFSYGGYTPPRYNPLNGKIDEITVYNRALSAAEVSTLSAFTLPLELVEFNGRTAGNGAVLNWKTTGEQNTESFDIERSTDGRSFTAVGNVAAVNRSGDHNYTYSDNTISLLGTQVVYYRLKQKDTDGRFAYSRIINLRLDNSKNTVLFYPNPVIHDANLSITVLKPEIVYGKIIDQAGRVVKQQQWSVSAGTTSFSIDLNLLAKGTYFLELKGVTIHERKQFVKQ